MGILRVTYALCVFFFHAGWLGGFLIMSPWKAIYSFFIISGFYMAFILNRKYVGKKNSYFLYISNRFLRIYPIYWLILLLSISYSIILLINGIDNGDASSYLHYYTYLHDHNLIMMPIAIASDVISSITLIIHSGYVRTILLPTGISSMAMSWTLGIELLFYLIAPFLVRWKGATRFFIIGSIFFIAYAFFHYRWLDFRLTSYFFIHSLLFFMLGYISYILYDFYPIKKVPKKILSIIVIIFLLFTLCYTLLPLPHLQYKWIVFNDWIYYTCVTIALPFFFQFSNQFKWDNIIADLSYPIYISHLFIIQILTYSHVAKPHTQQFIILALITTIIFSVLIVVFVERPIEKYRQKRIKTLNLRRKNISFSSN